MGQSGHQSSGLWDCPPGTHFGFEPSLWHSDTLPSTRHVWLSFGQNWNANMNFFNIHILDHFIEGHSCERNYVRWSNPISRNSKSSSKKNISATSAVLFQRKCKQLTQLTPITQLTLINATRLIICICVCKTLQVLPWLLVIERRSACPPKQI